MPNWLKPRFSLLSLMLLTTLVCVSVSHWVTTVQLDVERNKVEDLQKAVRVRNDRLHLLTVGDPSQVHIIQSYVFGKDEEQGAGPLRFEWGVYLPPSHKWEIRWAYGDTSEIAYRLSKGHFESAPLIVNSEFNPTKLDVAFLDSAEGWEIRIAYGSTSVLFPIPKERTGWLQSSGTIPWRAVGDSKWRGTETQSLEAGEPFILLRQWNPSTAGSTWEGVVVWLQPIEKN